MAAFWGTAEFFHEGWFPPYTQFIYYMIPFLVMLILSLVVIYFPLSGGIFIIFISSVFSLWWILKYKAKHIPVETSIWIICIIFFLTGIFSLFEGMIRKSRLSISFRESAQKRHWKLIFVIFLPILVALLTGIPLLIRNLNRTPLDSYEEITVKAQEIEFTFAGKGVGWLFDKSHPIKFSGKNYVGLSWNEIALFGKDPVGFEGKRYGLLFDGSEESIYYASQEDFNSYNMFRYINYEGDKLTEQRHHYWRLPTIEEYIKILMRRGENAGGTFDRSSGEFSYKINPDKEGPIWAPKGEVIYYWTSTEVGKTRAFDITFSGEPREIIKTTAQDYRGFRAVRIK